MRIDRFKWLLAVASIVAMGLVGCDDDDGGEPTDDMDMIGDTAGDTADDTSLDTGNDTNEPDTTDVGDDTTDVDDDTTDVDDDTTDVDDDTTDVDDDMTDTTDTTDATDTTDTEDMVDTEDMTDMCMPEPEVSWAACMDGVDNNCDGGIDDAVGCAICPPAGDPARTTDEVGTCDDGLDNDCDGFADCNDFDCSGDAACPVEDTDALCSDGLDNDGDGRIDCAGRSCAPTDGSVTVCRPAAGMETAAEDDMTLCGDGLDNDLDGFVDCDDSECDGIGFCGAEEGANCADGQDNDGDGRVDCLDTGCFDDAFCQGEGDDAACADGMDNDNDGRIDCADDSCYLNPGVNVCSGLDEICDNMMDDDGDGLEDCFDPSCGMTCEAQACSATNPVGTCANAGEVCTLAGECAVTLDAFTLPDDLPLIVTEFHPDPAVAGSDGEFIEILNTTTQRIVLDGASLDDSANTFALPPGISVGAGEYLLLGKDTMEAVGFTADAFFPWGLNNGGDTVTLSYNGTTIHEVVYPGTGNDLSNTGFGAGDGQSTQLDQDYIDSVLAGTPGTPNWCLTPPDMTYQYLQSMDMTLSDYGTPGDANVACSVSCGNAACDPWEDETSCAADCTVSGTNPDTAGQVIVSELMTGPTDAEFFELYNTTATDFELQGCTIGDLGTDSHVIASSVVIAAGSYATFARDMALAEFTPDYVYGGDIAISTSDEIVLTCNGTQIDAADFDPSTGWPNRSNDTSIQVDAGLFGSPATLGSVNDVGASWCQSTSTFGTTPFEGTPGAANDTCPVVP